MKTLTIITGLLAVAALTASFWAPHQIFVALMMGTLTAVSLSEKQRKQSVNNHCSGISKGQSDR